MKRYAFSVMIVLVVLMPWRQSLRADAAHYTVENLGNLGGLVPTITGVNASGQISGYVNGPDGARAVRYSPGTGWQYLPGLDTSFSQAGGINAAGDLVGFRFTAAGEMRGFRYRDASGVEDIAPLTGGSFTLAYGINTAGDVVGYGDSAAGMVAYIARAGQPAAALPTLGGGFAIACGINDAGQIAGSAVTPAGVQHAIRLDPGAAAPSDLSSFAGAGGFSAACAIDAAGRVGGQADGFVGSHAFMFDGVLNNLDAVFGTSQGNTESVNGGVSVGWFSAADSTMHAFVSSPAEGSVDLNDVLDNATGWQLAAAKAINASGLIVGEGFFNGSPVVYRLTKVEAPKDTTPPVISSVTADPSAIVPANDAMVPVSISIAASDDTDPAPVCSVTSVDTHGAPSSFASVTGPASGSVRAQGRALYTFAVRCVDAAGNAATGSVDVYVPPDTTAPVFTSLTASAPGLTPPKGQTVTVTVTISATDDSGVAPTCKLGYITGPGSAPFDFNVTGANTGTIRAVAGRTYTFNALCVDVANNVAWSSVSVQVPADTTAPVISRVTASPSTIARPDEQLVPVSLTVAATDDVDDAPACALWSITSSGTTADDYAIVGPFAAKVRASGGRSYTLTVRCADAAGNASYAAATVTVLKDTTAPLITSLSATPSVVWPPNGKWIPVSVLVTATDDVDANPSCALTSITGAASTEYIITSALTAQVRADKNADGSTRVYSLNLVCRDRAGNAAAGSTDVSISKDQTNGAKASPNGKK